MSESVDNVEGWGEYRKLVLKELERLNTCVETLTSKLSETSGKTAANTAALDRLSRLTWVVLGAVVSGLAGLLFKWVGH